MIEIYTDGSTLGNGKKDATGGFGVVVIEDGKIIQAHSMRAKGTTNNREEMKAILWALINYGDRTPTPVVYSDSSYCVNTFNQWMFNWASKGWIKSDKKVPENLEIIQAYYNWYQSGKRIELRKVAGHQGNYWNEIADKLATGKMTPKEVEIMCGINKVFEKGDKI